MSITDAGDGNDGGGNVGETPAWMNSMPDAYKQNEGFAKFGEAADAYAKFDELLTAEGSNLKIPGEEATDEERNAFYSKMGRPESADKYEVGKPDDWPENVPYDTELEGAFKEQVFAQNISGEAAKNLYDWYNGIMLDAHQSIAKADAEALTEATNELKKDWTGDKYKVNTELAHRAFKELAGDGEEAIAKAMDFIDDTKINGLALGEHPMFLRVFNNIASKIFDDSALSDRSQGDKVLSEEDKAKARFPKTKFKDS
jgi:hypothetical protein